MAMQRCRQGHYYDAGKSSTCPACGTDKGGLVLTKLKRRDESDAIVLPTTQPRERPKAEQMDNAPTVGVVRKQLGIDPVVGWLVCVSGAQRGIGYPLHSERNLIGRNAENDVCLAGDETISRGAHAVVSFDPRQQSFLLSAGDGRGLVYLNGTVVETAKRLEAYDAIELGQTKLMFVPFAFVWE